MLTSCENFLDAKDTAQEIRDIIDYNNTPSCTVLFKADEGTGTFLTSNEKPLLQVHTERILELRKLLADSDYYCLKHADGALTDEEYAPIKAQRQAWRDEINSLED